MRIIQKEFTLGPRRRGFHLITAEVEKNIPELGGIKKGVAHIMIKHTSASLTVNENADPSVRKDMENYFSNYVPEEIDLYSHAEEGPDDMTAHIKSTLIGSSINIPVSEGRFNLGIWQGIYLCEHRNEGGPRNIVVTIFGE
ncbi:MAG: secondary thiamine-phosphate synthase enzyme YjbQ [Bacteroidetes bacterium]|nr:secondary thiamine-phosphate synthase enzyme YjbQ [Bacteroidota bacterium]